jgi:hypothetical protein
MPVTLNDPPWHIGIPSSKFKVVFQPANCKKGSSRTSGHKDVIELKVPIYTMPVPFEAIVTGSSEPVLGWKPVPKRLESFEDVCSAAVS